ncbi:MAG: AAA family ATPase [Cyanobacteria bacterium P01_F01_bin.150]
MDKDKKSKTLKPIDIHDFIGSVSPNREWIVEGLICKGSTLVLYAHAGTGKTLLSYDLCKHIALGQDWNGQTVQQGKVLLIQTDEPQVDTQARFSRMNMGDVPKGQICIEREWVFGQLEQLEQWVAVEKPSLVVIDSLTSCNRDSGISERSAKYADHLYGLRDIADQHKCSILLLHHTTKNGAMRGSTAIGANVSEVWKLETADSGSLPLELACLRTLTVEKSRSECSGQHLLQLDTEDYSWQIIHQLPIASVALDPKQEKLYSILAGVPGAKRTYQQLGVLAAMTNETARRHLEDLVKQGLVMKIKEFAETNGGRQKVNVYFVEPDPQSQTERGAEGTSGFETDSDTGRDEEPPELV